MTKKVGEQMLEQFKGNKIKMGSEDKTEKRNAITIQKAAKIAGVIYFMTILTNILSLIIIDANLFVEGDATC